LMDGTRTVKEIHGALAPKFPHVSEKDVRDTIVSLAEEGTIRGTEPELDKRRVNVRSAFQVDVSLTEDSSKVLRPIYRAIKPALRRPVLIATVIFIMAGFVAFSSSFLHVLGDKSEFQIYGSTLLGWLLYNFVLLLPIYAIHEAAHGLACIHYGGTPGEMGTGMFYFSPMFYTDTSDSWRLSRWARVMVSLSGPISTLLIGSALAVVSFVAPSGSLRTFSELTAFLCFYIMLFNLSPVIENDGYYALTDVLNMPNLRGESFAYLKRLFGRFAGGGKAQKELRMRPKKRAILLGFALLAGGWIVLFFYSTLTVLGYLSQDAVSSGFGLGSMALALRFDAQPATIDIALLLYFGSLLGGYFLLLRTGVKRLRRRRFKLETIHDKFVAIFLPLPPRSPSSSVRRLMGIARRVALKSSHSYSVEWLPPFCIVRLKMGRALESLEEIRNEMRKVEGSFQREYSKFLSAEHGRLQKAVGVRSPGKARATEFLVKVSKQISSYSGPGSARSVSDFISQQERTMSYFLRSAVSSMWTLELEPDDYNRIRPDIFPAFLAEDYGETNLYGDVSEFKKHTVLGLDTMSELASSVEKESTGLGSRMSLYQATAFLEPIRGRLIFLGRTEELKRSPAKVARLFLVQNWSGYFDGLLKEANVGLAIAERTVRHRLGPKAIGTLRDNEVAILRSNFSEFVSLSTVVFGAIQSIKTGHSLALRAHRDLSSLIDQGDEKVDVGYYKAVLDVNVESLGALGKRIGEFERGYERLYAEFERLKKLIEDESAAREEGLARSRRRARRSYLGVAGATGAVVMAGVLGILSTLSVALGAAGLNGGFAVAYLVWARGQSAPSRIYTPAFESMETLLLSAVQSIYEVVSSSDILNLVEQQSNQAEKPTEPLNPEEGTK
jgi:hypothetical protein